MSQCTKDGGNRWHGTGILCFGLILFSGPSAFRHLLREFKEEVDEKGILPGDIYNMDETGFRIGVGGNQRIITMDIHRPHHSPSDTNRDYATSVEAVSGDGIAVEPMLIPKGLSHLEKWYTQTKLPDNYLIGTSDSGYTNDTLSIE